MVLVGSTTAISAKLAIRELPTELVPLIRFGIAAMFVAPWALRAGALPKLIREDGWLLLASATLSIPINQWFFLHGARLAPASHVGLIYASCPLVVLLLALGLGRERLHWNRLVGVLITVLGVVVLGLGGLGQGHAAGAAAGRSILTGDLLLVGAVLSWGMYLTTAKPLIVRHGAMPTLAGTFLLGSLLEIPLAVGALTTSWDALGSVSPLAWKSLAFLTLVPTIFGLSLQNLAMRRLDASQVAAVGNLAPVLTVIWSILLLGESLTPGLVLGGGLTLGGVYWANRQGAAPPRGEVTFDAESTAPALDSESLMMERPSRSTAAA